MPGEYPKQTSSPIVWTHLIAAQCKAQKTPLRSLLCRRFLLKSTTVLSGLTLTAGAAHAAADQGFAALMKEGLFQSMESTNILMLAVFGGAMSFALMSASWLIRERNQVSLENRKLKAGLADLRARNHLNEALINIPDQKIVVWNGSDEKPVVLGNLSSSSGAPEKRAEFLGFGTWLTAESASQFDRMLKDLRVNAKSFEMPLQTRGGGILESEGSTSGSHAFVRFRELSGERAEHATLTSQHTELLATFNTIQKLFEKMPMPVWLRRNDGGLFWANQAYAGAVEVSSPENAVERNAELFDQEQRNEIQEQQNTNGFFSGVRPAIVAGDRRSLDIFTVKTDAGIAGIANDKSDVDTMRGSLAETVEGHSRMLDQLATAVAIFDEKQRLTFHNSGFQKLWKLEATQLQNEPSNGELLDAMRDRKMLPEHPDWRKWRESQLEIYTALEPVEDWWHLPDGQTLRVVISPRNEGGATWIFENVTEKLELESSYNSLMRVQGETLDHLSEAVAVFGSDGKLKLFNPALALLWKFPKLEMAEGVHIAQIIEAWTDSISNESDLENIIGKVTGFDDERANLEGRLHLRNDVTLEYTLVPLPDGQTMMTLADITSNVNFEKALRDRAEALEESDHLKNRFIQHVSYELRAPLTNISGFGEMLTTAEVGGLNDKQSEYLEHINSSAEVLRAIVDDILDLASIDAQTMVLDYETVNLRDTLDEILTSFETAMLRQKITADIEIEKQCEEVVADRDRLAHILQNLVSNAVNYSPDGGKVSISAHQKDGFHEISVSDQGPGVPEELRQSIFDRFEGRSADGRRAGTGLGLSIVQSFVELHGGTVRLEAADERGARFVCRMPVSPKITAIDEPASSGKAA